MGLLSFLKRGEVNEGGKPARASRASADAVDDVQQLRIRARRRLIGSAVLVGVAVIVFPLLFETQPRPIPVDLPIDIPKKDGVAPMNVPAARTAQADTPAADPGREVITETADQASGDRAVPPPEAMREAPKEAPPEQLAGSGARTDVKPEAKARMAEPAREARVEPKPEPKPRPAEPAPKVAKAETHPDTKLEHKDPKPDAKRANANESARVQAMLDGSKPAAAAASAGRFVVQVGAYADTKAAQDARMKVERMGLKTYTQAVETADGRRIRVRVGPFGSRDEADKVAAKVRGGGLTSAVLTL